jgi:hypothetical protein
VTRGIDTERFTEATSTNGGDGDPEPAAARPITRTPPN